MSQSVIGALRVTLGLDSAQFDKGSKRAKDSLSVMRNQFAAVAGAAAAFGAAMSAVAMRVSSAANATGHVADRLGVNVEALQEMRHAADRAGMGVQNFDVALRRFIRRSSEAAQGTGAAKGAFEELDIQLTDSRGQLRDTEDLLADVADAMQSVESPADRLRLAFKMFDTDGAAMVNVLANGSEEFARMREEARQLGIVIDERTVRASQRLHDNLDTLRKLTEGVQNRIAAALIPTMVSLTDSFVSALQAGTGLQRAIDLLINNLQRIATYVGTAVVMFGTRYVGALIAARVATLNFAAALITVRNAFIRTGIGALIVGAGELVYQFSRLVQGAGGFGDALGLLKDVGVAIFNEMEIAGEVLRYGLEAVAWRIAAGFADAFKWIFDQWDRLINWMLTPFNALMEAIDSEFRLTARNPISWGFGEVSDHLKGFADTAQEAAVRTAGEMRQTIDAIDALREAVRGAEGDFEETNSAIDRFNDALEEIGDGAGGGSAGGAARALEETTDAMSRMGDIGGQITNRLAQGFTDMFTSALDGSKSLIQSIGELLKSLGQMLLNQGFQLLLTGGLGGGGGLFSGIGNFFTGIFGGFRAKGGPVTAGRTYMVGERGPEMFTPSTSGDIVPNHKLGEAMKSVVHLVVEANDYFDAHVQRISAQGDAQVVKTVQRNVPNWMNDYQMRGA